MQSSRFIRQFSRVTREKKLDEILNKALKPKQVASPLPAQQTTKNEKESEENFENEYIRLVRMMQKKREEQSKVFSKEELEEALNDISAEESD